MSLILTSVRRRSTAMLFFTSIVFSSFGGLATAAEPEFDRDVAPILNTYCAGCHNDEDAEGKLSLSSFAAMRRGGENGAVFIAGQADTSRMIQMMTGSAKPQMPPEDNEAPTKEEIKVLIDWITAGAIGPNRISPRRSKLVVPDIEPLKKSPRAITAIDWSNNGASIAVARFGELILLDGPHRRVQWRVTGLPGKVNSVRFSSDGQYVVVATGIAGLEGRALIYRVANGILATTISGHNDTIYAAVLNHDGSLLATAGYDRKIVLWDPATGRTVRTLTGHNDAIYDLDFNNDSTLLASASGDETIKLWNVTTGQRLDTRSEPLAEQYTVRFSPDGKQVLGGGADNRIRVWQVVSKSTPQINPILFSRFAHEGAVIGLRFARHAAALVSISEDRTVKLWEPKEFTPTHVFEPQSTEIMSLAISPKADAILIGNSSGRTKAFALTAAQLLPAEAPIPGTIDMAASAVSHAAATMNESVESEPNNVASAANPLVLPATVSGTIDAGNDKQADYDLFQFSSRAGQKWIVEVKADRDQSPLDSFIEILTSDGRPVEQVVLRAVRDSYFTFRGKDSSTSDDFRVHNWREMELNEYIYSKGEVNRLYMYPRGPDSGFQVYPGSGSRYAYFGSTANSHALHEPCYIVEPFPPGTKLLPNGLPVFKLFFENDDDGLRKLGKDSRLIFTAPDDGEYLVRIRDTRAFQGAEYKYKLIVRAPQPDFKVTLGGANPTVHRGSGREFSVSVDRIDGFDGEVKVDITGLPPGFVVTSPVTIEAGQKTAFGTINAAPDAEVPTADNAKQTKVVATAVINGQEFTHDVNNLGEVKLESKPSVVVELLPASSSAVVKDVAGEPLELAIEPGQTIQARVRIERNGFGGRVGFGKADGGRNLPHGLYIDDIGLNGLLIVETESERDFFITAAKWVPEQSRMFHLKSDAQGGHTSRPVIIHVRKPAAVVSN